MTHYFEISLKTKKSYEIAELLNAVYSTLHKKLWDEKNSTIGVSFPEYGQYLGKIIRIHGSDSELESLHQKSWLGQLALRCDFTKLTVVPENTSHACYSRVQQNQSLSKLKRYIKRNNPNEQEIRAYKAKLYSNGLDLPYLELLSTSTGQRHRVYIKKIEGTDEKTGSFSSYGLSKNGSTVPIF